MLWSVIFFAVATISTAHAQPTTRPCYTMPFDEMMACFEKEEDQNLGKYLCFYSHIVGIQHRDGIPSSRSARVKPPIDQFFLSIQKDDSLSCGAFMGHLAFIPGCKSKYRLTVSPDPLLVHTMYSVATARNFVSTDSYLNRSKDGFAGYHRSNGNSYAYELSCTKVS